MKPKRLLNKWQFVLTASHDFRYKGDGWRIADVGIFKLTSLPDDGVKPNKRHYKGFWFRFKFWFPIESY